MHQKEEISQPHLIKTLNEKNERCSKQNNYVKIDRGAWLYIPPGVLTRKLY